MEFFVAMVTPFRPDGSLDVDGAQRLAAHLVDVQGCDGLIVNGTTGEAPTTSDQEKRTLVEAVVAAVGDRATVVAGAGSPDTAHAVRQAADAEKSGAHGLLVVAPYYNRPSQEGVYRHLWSVAESAGLPVIVYDIPVRAGITIEAETLIRLAAHPRIRAVKDAACDVTKATHVMSATELRYYCGADEHNLPLYALGAAGVISTVGHLGGRQIRASMDALDKGDRTGAARLNQRLLPAVRGIMTRDQGAVTVKALLAARGLPAGPVRLPLVPAERAVIAALEADLAAAGW
ncbi:4-hydroxy-tetrahydrodipicolinate synthase [Streptosporangiaceae bacterium NEAU-GS5]|nr:4-hydroxy-tetrahydrodipicolinate synthase [Streptosporangiaceae bacterium NEAU-GS5]